MCYIRGILSWCYRVIFLHTKLIIVISISQTRLEQLGIFKKMFFRNRQCISFSFFQFLGKFFAMENFSLPFFSYLGIYLSRCRKECVSFVSIIFYLCISLITEFLPRILYTNSQHIIKCKSILSSSQYVLYRFFHALNLYIMSLAKFPTFVVIIVKCHVLFVIFVVQF